MSTNRKRVLVVDDERDMCWVLQILLAENGFDYRIAETGEDAIKLVEATEFEFALVDVKLTDTDGLDLARRIKAMNPALHIIMISGYYYKDDLDIQRTIQLGIVADFISKPFRHDEVIEILRRNRQTRGEYRRAAVLRAGTGLHAYLPDSGGGGKEAISIWQA